MVWIQASTRCESNSGLQILTRGDFSPTEPSSNHTILICIHPFLVGEGCKPRPELFALESPGEIFPSSVPVGIITEALNHRKLAKTLLGPKLLWHILIKHLRPLILNCFQPSVDSFCLSSSVIDFKTKINPAFFFLMVSIGRVWKFVCSPGCQTQKCFSLFLIFYLLSKVIRIWLFVILLYRFS